MDDHQTVLDLFARYGVAGEGIEQYGLVSLDISPDVDLTAVKAVLVEGEKDGRWHFEEGCVSMEWLDL